MGNFFTAWVDGMTEWLAASMNPALASLDKAITYGTKCPVVHCDGDITYSGGVLTWSGTIRILFISAAGTTIQNTIAAGNVTLTDNQFCYVDLVEVDATALTMQTASIATNSASNFVQVARIVMAYRNTTNDEIYPVFLPVKFGGSPADKLDGREQQITCATNVTIDWTLGATARMTFDRTPVNLTLSGGSNGKVYRFLAKQEAGGSDLINFVTAVKWRGGGTQPTLTATGNAEDIFTFVYINGSWYGDLATNFVALS